jgi:hypothetical protein
MVNTLKNFKRKGIWISDLPPNFQHAIHVTKNLGIHYIWIDSLCIIQDSDEDWRREASRMWEVYSNSYCTIAATASSDSHGGLFRDRNALSTVPCKVQPAWSSEQNGQYYCVASESWKVEVEDSPLNSRGWVLQERALSPRILHFGNRQLLWECRSLTASEAFPQKLPEAMKTPTVKENFDLLRLANVAANPDTAELSAHDIWANYVESYSRCHLTYGSDKLVALSGLARLIHTHLGENEIYLAGMFKSQLIRLMPWEVGINHQNGGTRPTSYRAPSWSWASTDGEINFPKPNLSLPVTAANLEELATLVEANTTPLEDPFGKVIDGLVRVRGLLFKATFKPNRDQASPDFFLNGKLLEKAYLQPDVGIHKGIIQGRNLHCMPFIVNDQDYIQGLILEPTGNAKGQFQRVGSFSTSGRENREMLETNDPNIDNLEYEDSGSHSQLISIV